MKNLILVFALLLLGGCAAGNTTSYQGTSNFQPNYIMPPVTLSIIEKRPYVLDGNKNLSYSGTQRSIGGVPYNVTTASGKPLAEDLQGLVASTLMKYGVIVEHTALLPMDITESEAVKKLTTKERKAILLFLNEWRTHIYFNPIFEYDLKMLVVGTHGNILSTAINKGTKEFGNNKELKNFAEVLTVVFNELFNEETIKLALLTDESPLASQVDTIKDIEDIAKVEPTIPTTKEQKCTTDQILKMKEMSMSDDQIRAACDKQIVNNNKATDFLESNKAKQDVITTNSGLQYMVIRKGDGPKPKADDTVTVHYRGTLLDGTEFDSTYKRNQPATFPLNKVIAGWAEGVQLMNVGSKFRLFISPELAYGDRGAPPVIKPGDMLLFEIELLDIYKDNAMETTL